MIVMEKIITKQNNILVLPKIGEVVNGKVVGIKRSAIYIDLGAIGTGIIYGREFYEAKTILKDLVLGSEVFAKVTELDNEDGYIELSLKQASQELAWKTLQEKKDNDEAIEVKILGANKGGLLGKAFDVLAFLPVSQLSFEHYPRVEEGDKFKITKELQKFIGEKLKVKILDIDREEEKLILSEKALKFSVLKKAFKDLKVGMVVDGEITGVVDFGAFIKFLLPDENKVVGSNNLIEKVVDSLDEVEKETDVLEDESSDAKIVLEGLIHISELDWQLIDNASKIVKVGDKVKAKIIEVANNRISLSLKALKKNPWEGIEKKYKKGDIIKAKVTKFNLFGVFIEVAPQIQALVHISEFGDEAKMKKSLEIGKEYDFEILQVDQEYHKIALKVAAK